MNAILFSRLYFPEFVEVNDCIILKERYHKSIFNEWFRALNGDITEVEKMYNLYEVKDLFHINDCNISEEKIQTLASLLSTSWEINLSILFSHRKFTVKVFQESDTTFITFYSF